eukprot:TRINITY_DN69_c0_g1_i2.p1 TRINITY_DN69_c0_g1~~TRINITY_DN69_c0_g1_i2.p1  ORF type:complete len:269 (+),score=27.85 TRINITY_DN69_c0_g1_i2:57-863(+)
MGQKTSKVPAAAERQIDPQEAALRHKFVEYVESRLGQVEIRDPNISETSFADLPSWPGTSDDMVDVILHEPNHDVRYLLLKILSWKTNKDLWKAITKPKFDELANSFLLNLNTLDGKASHIFLFGASLGALSAVKIAMPPGISNSADWNLPQARRELLLFQYLDIIKSGAFERSSQLQNQLRSILSDPKTANAFVSSLWKLFIPWYTSCSTIVHASTLHEAKEQTSQCAWRRCAINCERGNFASPHWIWVSQLSSGPQFCILRLLGGI